VARAADLAPLLAEALAAPAVTVIDCPVDYRENLRLTAKLGQMVCPI
jgi:acetolactate synthase-1/2/3 large subunit